MKISVVTPSYNSAATIRDTLDSVLRQTYADVESVVIDGGSTDGTVEILKEYEKKFGGRMKWISERDGGIYCAMNKGVARAGGDVVGILNSDDFFASPTVLESVAEAFYGGKCEAVYGDVFFVDPLDLERCTRYYSSSYFRPWMMGMGYQPAHTAFYCLKSCYDSYGDYKENYRIAGDFEWLFRLIYLHRIRMKYISCRSVTMRRGGASTSGLKAHLKILREHYRCYIAHGCWQGLLLDPLRYPFKLIEVALSRLFVRRFKRN